MTDTRGGLNVNAGAFAVSPELAAGAYQQISQLQDVVGEMVREARVLGRTVPLGGGYAGEVGEFMARYGLGGPGSAADSLIRFGQELETLKTNIRRALQRYSDSDDDAAEGVDCSGG
ncbi:MULTISPECIES: hypothetical protein [Amycolatopsis]|uniref:Uncharacterized protein n=1 Tax=Amycolatopsis tucumanensis TaxID=401106 RepID=A0ABP7ISN1_9PSEU|nr:MULTISPECIES: hypothetical protein [Amycolatopsis]MCF6424717.1 hypothetical protein [Amycolatopsis tucumanensis]